MSKILSKCIAFCDYFDKSLIISSATSGSISIAPFAIVIRTPVGIASASFTLYFHYIAKIAKKTRDKKKKHNEIIMLARSKLNSIENKVSEALINNEIS